MCTVHWQAVQSNLAFYGDCPKLLVTKLTKNRNDIVGIIIVLELYDIVRFIILLFIAFMIIEYNCYCILINTRSMTMTFNSILKSFVTVLGAYESYPGSDLAAPY